MLTLLLGVSALAVVANAKIFFEEQFSDGDKWTDRWVESTNKGDEAGEWKLSAGKFFGDAEADKGIQTSQDARFYQISADMGEEFSNKDKTLVIQYAVKHEQNIDCGGAYVKLLPAGLDQGDFNGDSDYNIMFGPDICGATKRVHVIFNYDGKNHLLNKEIPCESDESSHLYTLIVNSDNTYEVKIDNESKQTGSLTDDWDMLPPKKINDPDASKPEDWDDRSQIDDPEDVKPDDWDDVEAQIADPDAEKPDDWDDELDGDWEAPMIDNPEYKGEWSAKQIDNPDYKGAWEHPQIDNPEYKDDPTIYSYDSHKFVGIEIWQVKSGTIFDRFLVTDDVAVATEQAEDFLKNQKVEKEALEKQQEEERKKAEEERKKAEAEKEEEEEEEDEEDADEEEDSEEENLHDDL